MEAGESTAGTTRDQTRRGASERAPDEARLVTDLLEAEAEQIAARDVRTAGSRCRRLHPRPPAAGPRRAAQPGEDQRRVGAASAPARERGAAPHPAESVFDAQHSDRGRSLPDIREVLLEPFVMSRGQRPRTAAGGTAEAGPEDVHGDGKLGGP